jgi:hypothetical protein
MSNFRTKLLGLAAIATAFAGVSYGQATLAGNCAASPIVTSTPAGNPTLRAEGETELVSDLVVAGCTNTGATATGTVYAVLSTPLTGRSETAAQGGGAFAGNSDIVLTVVTTGPGASTTYYAGTVTGLTVTFNNVSFPATPGGGGLTGFSLQTQNVRVNASTGGAPQVTESLLITYPNAAVPAVSVNIATVAANVGYILSSLSYALVTNSSGTPIISNITTCAGNPISASALPTLNFTVNVKQLVAGAFKLLTTTAGTGENGSLVTATTANLATTTGLATQATQINLVLSNVPAAATVYVPLSVNTGTSGSEVLTLAGTPAVATTPASVVGYGAQAGLIGVGLVAFTPTNGTINIVYTPLSIGTGGTVFPVPVYVSVAANASAVQTAITANVSYTPALAITGPAAQIPTFAVSTTAAVSTSKVTACSTTLLFPYVTNATGFETGIAIANTTTDNLGTTTAAPSVAPPTNGTCTINFYGGQATQPTAVTTPTLGVNTTAAPTIVPVYANTLTAMTGATNFTGYAIASCNFQLAHGFAFITDLTGQFSGAMGYLAVVVPNNRTDSATGSNITNE